MVLFDPSGSGVCRLAQPLFEKALTNADKILNVANQRNSELSDAGYGTQIHFNPNQTLLFLNDKNARRVRVDIDDSGQFLLKYPDGHRPVAREDLLKTCSESPQYLSPNVALRPLMQDSLLPTVAYVGDRRKWLILPRLSRALFAF
ncbi:MAG: bacillithiol biosynthesis BshC [Calditrichia bacterium]